MLGLSRSQARWIIRSSPRAPTLEAGASISSSRIPSQAGSLEASQPRR